MQSFAVIGSNGRLGHMLRYAVGEEAPLLWHTRASASSQAQLSWAFSDDPQRSAEALARQLADVAGVLCLAGLTPTAKSDVVYSDDDYRRLNVDLPLCLYRACALANVPRLLVASSAAVYGPQGPMSACISEQADLKGKGIYAASKQQMERALLEQGADVETCVLRIGNVAGADQLLQNLTHRPMPLDLDVLPGGTGLIRPYIGPLALGHLLYDLLQTPHNLPPVLNLSLEGHTSMVDLLEAWNRLAPHKVSWRTRPAPEGAIPTVGFDVSALKQIVDVPAPSDMADHIIKDLLGYLTHAGQL